MVLRLICLLTCGATVFTGVLTVAGGFGRDGFSVGLGGALGAGAGLAGAGLAAGFFESPFDDLLYLGRGNHAGVGRIANVISQSNRAMRRWFCPGATFARTWGSLNFVQSVS